MSAFGPKADFKVSGSFDTAANTRCCCVYSAARVERTVHLDLQDCSVVMIHM
jgi:hypothetical protein